MNIPIEIVRRGNGRAIGPKDTSPHTSGGRTRVKTGDVVTFTIPGAANSPRPTLEFNGSSPFAGAVTYNTPLRVVGSPSSKIFTYNCRAVIDGETLSSDSGGEMEIIPG
jgi:hypothetical protein